MEYVQDHIFFLKTCDRDMTAGFATSIAHGKQTYLQFIFNKCMHVTSKWKEVFYVLDGVPANRDIHSNVITDEFNMQCNLHNVFLNVN